MGRLAAGTHFESFYGKNLDFAADGKYNPPTAL
jgi:hypothetical protein